MIKLLTTILLLSAGAQAQFGPSVTSTSTSLGPAPTESIGCRIVDGSWECAAPRTSAASSASSALSDTSQTPTSTTPTETSGSSSGIPGPPVESTGCELHGDHYHCEGPAEGYEGTTATGTAEPSIPSPTESSNCIWRMLLVSMSAKLMNRHQSLGLLRLGCGSGRGFQFRRDGRMYYPR
jgi:zinc transporter 1/2/3